MSDPYKVLGVSRTASDDEVKKARRKLLLDLHPDRLPAGLPAGAALLIKEKVLEINNAFNEVMQGRADMSSRQSTASTAYQKNNQSTTQTSQKPEPKQTAQAPKNSVANKSPYDQTSSSASNKQESPTNGALKIIGQVFGALIGVAMMQTCRSIVTTVNSPHAWRQKAEAVIYSQDDYCPELVASIRNKDESPQNVDLKFLSEMRRSSPEGSNFRVQVDSVIAKVIANNPEEKESSKQEVISLFKKYMSVTCKGELEVAKLEANGISGSQQLGVWSKAQLTFAKAICSAMKNKEKMGTKDDMRSIGAIYMGREMDLMSEEDKTQIYEEIIKNVDDKAWNAHTFMALIHECPDDAFKMTEKYQS